MILANASNGLAYQHDDVCMFLSQFAHHKRLGYFRIDSMPHKASIHLMRGGEITIVEGRRRGGLSDALAKGVPTWCLVFNRAAGFYGVRVCEWQTVAMAEAAGCDVHKSTVQALRRLMRIYPPQRPAIIGENLYLDCRICEHDDNPELLAELAGAVSQ